MGPTEIKYERVHSCRTRATWCTYVLVQPKQVPASNLTTEADKQKFNPILIDNNEFFEGIHLSDEQTARNLETTLQQKIHRNDSFFETGAINSHLDNLLEGFREISIKWQGQFHSSSNGAQVASEILFTTSMFLGTWAKNVMATKQLTVTKELPLNDWRITTLKPELEKFGLKHVEEYFQNQHSMFGTSKPDFVFEKPTSEGNLHALVVKNVELFGATIEFKVDGKDGHLAQLFADMIKVSNDLLINALKRGNVVDSVTVFGMLVSHNKGDCIPARHFCDFENNKCIMELGQSLNFCKFFSLLVVMGC